MTGAPTFLFCVGATKAGTTWLHDQLSAHPDCHLRTIKEYHYFSTHSDPQWAKMIGDTHSEIAELAALPIAEVSAFEARRLDDLRAWLPMIEARRIDPAAFAQFLTQGAQAAHPNAKLVGDFTPAYSVISGKFLEPIRQLGAGLKVVYLIREPLARLWSHIRMTAERAAPDAAQDAFAAAAADTLQRVILGAQDGGIRGIVRRGDYAGNLPKLRRVFGPQLMVMFTEDLFTKAGFDRLLAFLGIARLAPDLSKRVHEGRGLPFPASLRRAAPQFLRPQYEFVAAEFPKLPQLWQDAIAELDIRFDIGAAPKKVMT